MTFLFNVLSQTLKCTLTSSNLFYPDMDLWPVIIIAQFKSCPISCTINWHKHLCVLMCDNRILKCVDDFFHLIECYILWPLWCLCVCSLSNESVTEPSQNFTEIHNKNVILFFSAIKKKGIFPIPKYL